MYSTAGIQKRRRKLQLLAGSISKLTATPHTAWINTIRLRDDRRYRIERFGQHLRDTGLNCTVTYGSGVSAMNTERPELPIRSQQQTIAGGHCLSTVTIHIPI